LFSSCLSSKNSKKEIFALSFPAGTARRPSRRGKKQSVGRRSYLREERVSSEMERGRWMGVSGQTGSSLAGWGHEWAGSGLRGQGEAGSIAGQI
jgi:hypothetical protein